MTKHVPGYDADSVSRVTFDDGSVGSFFVDIEATSARSLIFISSNMFTDAGGTPVGTPLFDRKHTKNFVISICIEEDDSRYWKDVYCVDNCVYDSYSASFSSRDKSECHETLVVAGEIRAL